MEKNEKTKYLAVGLVAFALIFTGITSVSAFEGERGDRDGSKHAEAIETFENNDYDAFKAIIADKPFADEIDEGKFSVLVEAHELRQVGDKEGAKELLDDAGINRPGHHKGHRYKSEKFLEQLNNDQQDRFEEAKEIREAGDREGAREIMESIFEELKPKN
jgi:hypothetical protein